MKIAIIGGGAAGLMAAVAALETNPAAEIVLLEKNKTLGNKVLLTGGGRCNVTTGIDDVRTVLQRYPRGGKFLSSAMHRFPPSMMRSFFEAHGVPIKIEADQRAFPVSEDGQDIVNVFRDTLQDSRVTILYEAAVERVEKRNLAYVLSLKDGRPAVIAERLILATGGRAYRQTGSSGDGYTFAETFGHTITSLHPSLSNLKLREKWPADLSGVSFERAEIRAADDKKMSQVGPFIFTHLGISGPAVFALSALVADRDFTPKNPLKLLIDLFPDEPPETTLAHFVVSIAEQRKRSFRNALANFIPKSLATIACRELNIDPCRNAAEISKKDLLRAATWLNAIPVNAVGRSAGEEFVTAGGVALDEVNPSTMESKITPGLYFCGELLNIDGFTGGFNLSAAWATGYLAGENAAK